AELRKIILRKINAAHGGVFFHVTNDVGELKSQAEAFGKGLSGGIPVAENPDADQSHHGSYVVTVDVEIVEGAVANRRFHTLLDIHSSAVGELVQQFNRDLVAALAIGQSQQDGIVSGVAGDGAMDRIQPLAQFVPPLSKGHGVVIGDVIAAAHERVHGAERL